MKKSVKAAALLLCAAAVASVCGLGRVPAAAAVSAQPYNITVGVGSSESEACFCWSSADSSAGTLEIAKADDVKNGQFPAGSGRTASAAKKTATEGFLDNPGSTNTDRPVSSYQDANGAALADEYSDKVTVQGLTPGVSYTYRVGNGTVWSKAYTFTPQSTAGGFSFAAFGDPQVGASGNLANDTAGWAKTLQKVTAKYPTLSFLFTMGDEVNDYDKLYKQQNEYRSFFNPDASSDIMQTTMLAAYSGNHDFQMGRYFSYHYNLPNLSPLGQTITNKTEDANGDFWFRRGNTLFLVLEGNNFYDVSAHDSFLKQAAAANQDAVWKVAAYHQAPYSEANHDGANTSDDDVLFMRANWTKLMDKYGIDVVLNGHDHYYTRSFQMYGGAAVNTEKVSEVTDPKGTVYFTLDSASGSKYYKYNTAADHSFSAFGWQNKQPTYSVANVTASEFTLATYTADTDQQIDTYTIHKTSGTASSPSSPAASAAGNASSPSASASAASGSSANPKTGDSGTGPAVLILVILSAGALAATLLRVRQGKA